MNRCIALQVADGKFLKAYFIENDILVYKDPWYINTGTSYAISGVNTNSLKHFIAYTNFKHPEDSKNYFITDEKEINRILMILELKK